MSTDRREAVGIRHLTVVPENFEPSTVPDHEDEEYDTPCECSGITTSTTGSATQ